MQIKKKYGLQKEQYIAASSTTTTTSSNSDYVDRAKVRRQVVGSEHPSLERIAEAASVHVPISTENKGFKMLSKMGWSEGEGLNSKRKLDSISQPLSSLIRVTETAGLGSSGIGEALSVGDIKLRQQRQNLSKTIKRYHGVATTNRSDRIPSNPGIVVVVRSIRTEIYLNCFAP